MRLDKYLASAGLGTRKEVKKILKQTSITVNGQVIKDESFQVSQTDVIKHHNQKIIYFENLYLMLNKPAGVICATVDNYHQTIIDLITDYKQQDLFPVGRLDRDTVGLIIITNDGELTHKLLAPTKHVKKQYYIEFTGELTNAKIKKLETGVVIKIDKEDYFTKPAEFTYCHNQSCYLTITEGKFHQVKKMFQAVDLVVTYLKRVKFGDIVLDENLQEGQYRLLTEEEIEKLKSK